MLASLKSNLAQLLVMTAWCWLPMAAHLALSAAPGDRADKGAPAVALFLVGFLLFVFREWRVWLFERHVLHALLPFCAAILFATWADAQSLASDAFGAGIVLGGVLGSALAWFVWNAVLVTADPDADPLHIRGSRRRRFEHVKTRAANASRPGETMLQFGPLSLPAPLALNNFLIVGAPGSGKTMLLYLALQTVLRQIVPGAGKRAVIYDAKTETISRLPALGYTGEVVLTSFTDARAAAWQLGEDFTQPHTIAEAAELLFPAAQSGHANQHFFDHAVRDIAQGVMLSWNTRFPGALTLRDLINSMESEVRLRQVLAWDLEANHTRLQLYFGQRDTLLNILATIASKVEPYRAIAAFWHHAPHRFSLTRWLDESSVLVLGRPTVAQTAADTLNSLLLARLTQLLVDTANRHEPSTYVFLDEVGKAGKLRYLDQLLLQGRSKGVRAWLGLQSIGSLRATYGHDIASDLTAGCGNVAILALAEPDTAKWAEELWAKQERWEPQIGSSSTSSRNGGSTTRSENWSIVSKPTLLSSEPLSLVLPSKRTRESLGGYYRVPGLGSFGAEIEIEFLEKSIPDTTQSANDPNAPLDFVPAPHHHAALRRWTLQELRALGLPADGAGLGAPPDDDGAPPPRRPRAARPAPNAPTLDDVPNLFGSKKRR